MAVEPYYSFPTSNIPSNVIFFLPRGQQDFCKPETGEGFCMMMKVI